MLISTRYHAICDVHTLYTSFFPSAKIWIYDGSLAHVWQERSDGHQGSMFWHTYTTYLFVPAMRRAVCAQRAPAKTCADTIATDIYARTTHNKFWSPRSVSQKPKRLARIRKRIFKRHTCGCAATKSPSVICPCVAATETFARAPRFFTLPVFCVVVCVSMLCCDFEFIICDTCQWPVCWSLMGILGAETANASARSRQKFNVAVAWRVTNTSRAYTI